MNADRVFIKCAWRLVPFMVLLYVAFFLDRVNVGFAALTMNKDLDFSPSAYGFGAGLLFIGFSAFSIPSSVIMERLGARRWLFATLMIWGALSASTAFVRTPAGFYALRFLLGVAEAGFVPGMVFYLSYWFPKAYRMQFTAAFLIAQPVAFVIGAPISGLTLELDGALSLHGWQWLFLVEGLPSCVLAVAALVLLSDRPAHAAWLSDAEKRSIAERLSADEPVEHSDLWRALGDARVIALGFVNFGVFIGLSGITLWLPLIVQAMGYSNLATSFMVAVPFAAAIVAMILWGRSSDRRGELFWHVALPLFVTAAGFAMASFAASDWVALVGLSLAVTGIYPALSPLIGLPSSFLGGAAGAGGTALIYAVGGVGAFLGPAAIGYLKQATGTYSAAMGFCALAMVFAALLVLGVGRAMGAGRAPVHPETRRSA
jgi:ACS family tartrate transporter-like MFS transporter